MFLDDTINHAMPAPVSDSSDDNCAFRAVIMEPLGSMGEVWLPAIAEGRYYFESGKIDEKFPVFMQAVDGRWVLTCQEGAYLQIDQRTQTRNAQIFDRAQFEMNFQGKKYYIYIEAEDPEDGVFVPFYIEKSDCITIGRLSNCDIFYPRNVVSRVHATLSWRNGSWYIRDEDSTNGVYVNGLAVRRLVPEYGSEKKETQLSVGDRIFIMGLRMVLGVNYISLNSASGRVKITSPMLRQIRQQGDVRFAPPVAPVPFSFFNRLPRRRDLVIPEPIEIEAPPHPMTNKMPLLLRMGTPLLTGGRSLISGNVVGAVTSMMMPMLTQGFTEKDRKEYETLRQKKYNEYLAMKHQEIDHEVLAEQANMQKTYPDVQTVLQFATHPDRLWERQKSDSDFLTVRIGWGNIPMAAEKVYPQRRFDLEHDDLEEAMYCLGEREELVTDAPVNVSLVEHHVCGMLGKSDDVTTLIRNMIVQFAMTHSYDELKMVLICDEKCCQDLDFALYLPHFWNNDRTVRYVAASRTDAQQLSGQLMTLYEKYNDENAKRRSVQKTEPAVVVFVQSRELYDAIEVVKDMAADEAYCGFSVITCFDNPPKETSALIHLGDPCRLVDLKNPERKDQDFFCDTFPKAYAESQLHRLMNTKLQLPDQQATLPNMVTFLDMYNVGMVEHLNPLKRWQENNPVKSLAAPIGVSADGKLFTLDLHEKKQGPHGLVAGGTGSGKSEFIITYILSMAVNFSPDEVAFLLIDYKGGGLADAFVDKKRGIHLPHVVGTITNLDGAGIQRSLVSINSELKRRQALFSKAKSETNEGTMDIYDYQKLYRQKRVKEPLPHLFIISDEFAELKKQQPEFMDELISTARIGRSLGVHLILATQKPAGVVNDQIWSNTKFRVCLRVADKSDSMEMLKRPEAAEIRNTGRFYLQVGYNELFEQGQSAWCGAGYEPKEHSEVEGDHSVQFVDRTGQVILNAKPEVQKKASTTKQIVAIVQYLSNLAKREKIVPRMLWKDPLPEELEFADIASAVPDGARDEMLAVVGKADDPERQKQFPAVLDFMSFRNLMVIGGSGMGKSTFLRTMLYSLVHRYSPEDLNYYLVDLSGSALNVFRRMPHCGAYLTQDNEAEFTRLMAMLREIAAERKELFMKAEVTSFDAYLEVAKLPLILLVIDSYQNILTAFSKGSEIYTTFHNFMTEVSAYGIHFVLTASHSNEISTKCKQELDSRISICPPDRYDASDVLNAKPKNIPAPTPGRGIYLDDGRPLEFQVATPHAGEIEQTAVQMIRADLDALSTRYGSGTSVRKLPILNSGEEYASFIQRFPSGRIPIGYHVKDMKPLALPLRQLVSMCIYLGNPNGTLSVLRNLLSAAQREDGEVLVVRKSEDSAFSPMNNLLREFRLHSTVFKCQEDELAALGSRLNNTVISRNDIVNEYSDMAGIPRTERGRARKAIGYMISKTKPLFVLVESLAEFCKCKKDPTTAAQFNAFVGGLKGYNIYFIGLAAPEDQTVLRTDPLFQRFNGEEIRLFFGGRYHLQCLSPSLPNDYRRMDKVIPDYDRGLMYYREAWYEIQMPCGTLVAPDIDPDDAPII